MWMVGQEGFSPGGCDGSGRLLLLTKVKFSGLHTNLLRI